MHLSFSCPVTREHCNSRWPTTPTQQREGLDAKDRLSPPVDNQIIITDWLATQWPSCCIIPPKQIYRLQINSYLNFSDQLVCRMYVWRLEDTKESWRCRASYCRGCAMWVAGSSWTSRSILSLTIGMSSDTAGSYTCTALMAKYTKSKQALRLVHFRYTEGV